GDPTIDRAVSTAFSPASDPADSSEPEELPAIASAVFSWQATLYSKELAALLPAGAKDASPRGASSSLTADCPPSTREETVREAMSASGALIFMSSLTRLWLRVTARPKYSVARAFSAASAPTLAAG